MVIIIMNDTLKLKVLSPDDYEKALELFTLSFSDMPQLPALHDTPGHTKSVMRLLFNLHENTNQIFRYGLTINGHLISAAHCIDAAAQPTKRRLLSFAFLLFRVSGFKILRQLLTYNKHKPFYDTSNLEIMLYGTLPDYQKQGYGKLLMDYIYAQAKKQGYAGVTGVTNKSKPAYAFYMKNKWFVDTEFSIGNHTLCWVRRLI